MGERAGADCGRDEASDFGYCTWRGETVARVSRGELFGRWKMGYDEGRSSFSVTSAVSPDAGWG